MYIKVVVNLQLAELALDQQAAEGVREAAALVLSRLSLLNKYKVTDVSAALCRCLLTDSKQVGSRSTATSACRILQERCRHDVIGCHDQESRSIVGRIWRWYKTTAEVLLFASPGAAHCATGTAAASARQRQAATGAAIRHAAGGAALSQISNGTGVTYLM